MVASVKNVAKCGSPELIRRGFLTLHQISHLNCVGSTQYRNENEFHIADNTPHPQHLLKDNDENLDIQSFFPTSMIDTKNMKKLHTCLSTCFFTCKCGFSLSFFSIIKMTSFLLSYIFATFLLIRLQECYPLFCNRNKLLFVRFFLLQNSISIDFNFHS